MSKRVAVYARVSTARQADNDISIPDQLAQARRFCEGRGWIVTREFIDAGASARDDKRPELQRMMDKRRLFRASNGGCDRRRWTGAGLEGVPVAWPSENDRTPVGRGRRKGRADYRS